MAEILDALHEITGSFGSLELAELDELDLTSLENAASFINPELVIGEGGSSIGLPGREPIDFDQLHYHIDRGNLGEVAEQLGIDEKSLAPLHDLEGIRSIQKVSKLEEAGVVVGDELTDAEAASKVKRYLKSNKWSSMMKSEWLGKGALVVGGVITVSTIVQMVRNHQKEMNGCWIVDVHTGLKCKVTVLSGCNSGGGGGSTACPSCSGGGGALLLCSDEKGRCSPFENCDRRCAKTKNMAPGTRHKCVSVNFAGAFEDLAGKALDSARQSLVRWIPIFLLLFVGVFLISRML